MTPRVWTCRRVSDGIPCRTVNPRKYQVCRSCGKRRPPTPKPAHRQALELPYEVYVDLNGGDVCGICGKTRTEDDRKFDRDHCHATGQPRGLLCWACNRQLRTWATVSWLRAAADYLERAAVRV